MSSYRKYLIYRRTIMLKRRIILLILCIIWVLSLTSLISLLLYFDPYIHRGGALILLLSSFTLCVSSICTVLLYFFKKIYYRGNVRVYHIFSSLRQSIFLAIWCIAIGTLISFQIPVILTGALFACLLIFLEFFIQNL